MDTIKSAIIEIEEKLQAAGIDQTRSEARLLLCHVMDIEMQVIIGYPERPLNPEQKQHLNTLLERRTQREPLSQILGEREFWSLPFKVTRDTLTPRPDSETLIEAVLRHFPDPDTSLQVLDLGVGTGCLLLSTLSEYSNAIGTGVDISPKALSVAKENAQRLELEKRSRFTISHWAQNVVGPFDLVLSNPPYIALTEKEDLDPEVREHEPASALFAGEDGLSDYRQLAEQLPVLLRNENSRAVIELGAGQADAVSTLMENRGLCVLETPQDLAGHVRCLVLGKKT